MRRMTEAQKEHCRGMAEAIARKPEAYNQRTVVYDCGTTACLAGWSLVIKRHNGVIPPDGVPLSGSGEAIFADAGGYMGLTREEREDAFACQAVNHGPSWIPKARDAVHCLREYVETGRWKWLRAPEQSAA